ncbi:hypothetical protein MMEU_2497 [Mycobacterium marinum str. Europe]|nr:hypothetical protein MMEU_2497 [Mycobacterium marinum str. Europe]
MLPGADAMGGSVAEFGEQTEAVQAQGRVGHGRRDNAPSGTSCLRSRRPPGPLDKAR